MLQSLTRPLLIGVTLAVCLVFGAGPASADKCTATKLKAIGKKEAGLLSCQAKIAAKGDPSLEAECNAKVFAKFTAAFAKAGACTGIDGIESDCEGIADDCAAKVRAA